MNTAPHELLRQLPSVDEVLRLPEMLHLAETAGQSALTRSVREVLQTLRAEIGNGTVSEKTLPAAMDGIAEAVRQHVLRATDHSLRTLINATGVVLHTNLGRAPLSQNAVQRIAEVATGYCNLEFDLEQGKRGKRDIHLQKLFSTLLEGFAPYDPKTVVVNNCAAAVLVSLNSLAEGGEVIVSRGELVEIGGSFRVPDVMAKSQAILREVGTTNRTRIFDYENAITGNTKLLLRVHRSNFAIVGFTEQPTLQELVELGQRRGIPVMEDLGNGALLDLRSVGVEGEGGVTESLRAGVDLITYSGDKLLGGPQAGMITGRPELVTKVRHNPLFRALRADKLTYAALEATLLDYLRGDHAAIPAIHMMKLSAEEIGARAEQVMNAVTKNPRLKSQLIDGESVIGGGTTPQAVIPTRLLALTVKDLSAFELQRALRKLEPAIIARVDEGRVLLDLRTVFPAQDAQLAAALLLL